MPQSSYYKWYIGKSKKWQKKRKAALKRAKYTCQGCGAKNTVLQVHHLTYERLGKERAADLRVLCRPCHRKADIMKKMARRVRRLTRRGR